MRRREGEPAPDIYMNLEKWTFLARVWVPLKLRELYFAEYFMQFWKRKMAGCEKSISGAGGLNIAFLH